MHRADDIDQRQPAADQRERREPPDATGRTAPEIGNAVDQQYAVGRKRNHPRDIKQPAGLEADKRAERLAGITYQPAGAAEITRQFRKTQQHRQDQQCAEHINQRAVRTGKLGRATRQTENPGADQAVHHQQPDAPHPEIARQRFLCFRRLHDSLRRQAESRY